MKSLGLSRSLSVYCNAAFFGALYQFISVHTPAFDLRNLLGCRNVPKIYVVMDQYRQKRNGNYYLCFQYLIALVVFNAKHIVRVTGNHRQQL
jgi:hypothetical protein